MFLKKYLNIKKKKRFNIKYYNNYVFSYYYLIDAGFHFGGNIFLRNVETLSLTYGKRKNQLILNLNLIFFEISKVLRILTNIGFLRGIIYFINSYIGFRFFIQNWFSFFEKKEKNFLNFFNGHFFNFTLKSKKDNFFFPFFEGKKEEEIKSNLFSFIFNLKQSIFLSSKWPNGLLTNYKSFYRFSKNLYRKQIKSFQRKNKHIFEYKYFVILRKLRFLRKFFDKCPRIPSFGIILDNDINHDIVKEFLILEIPCSSFIDNHSKESSIFFYGIPGNGMSVESLSLLLALIFFSYMSGLFDEMKLFQKKKFFFEKNILFIKKNIFFKKYIFFL